MLKWRLLAMLVAGALTSLLGTRPLRAQVNANPDTAGIAAKEHAPSALELYREALVHYNVGRYDEAIALFERAYLISRAPELLYNMAQAHRLKGVEGCAPALRLYSNYARLARMDPRKRRSVEAVVADMERCIREHPSPATDIPSRPTRVPATFRSGLQPAKEIGSAPNERSRPTTDDLKQSRRHNSGASKRPPRAGALRWPWIVVAGVGLAATIGGAVALGWAKVRHDDLVAEGCAPACDPNSVDPARTAQTAGWALVGGGLALAVGGALLWLLGAEQPDHRASTGYRVARWIDVGPGVLRAGARF